ncbi:MAG: LysR family transcriptional regulator [Thermodesulfobacteriota bacterium]|nr:LysR family transcriptional regulator [Thermodesulfobacteriota bacterium]
MSFIEVRHLKLVKAIADSGTMTRAAEKLYVTQPALSQQLTDLEGKLEIALFHRTKKKMILTSAGEALLTTAGEVLDSIKQTELRISKMVHGETGKLRIGTTCMLSYKWLPDVMRQLQEAFPKVDIELKTSMEVLEDLKNNKLDLVISTMVDDHPAFITEPLFKDEILITMSPRDLLAAKAFLIAEDFEGTNLISYQDPIKGDLYNDYLSPAGIEPAKLIRVDQPEAALELIKSGFGISLFPKWAIKPYLASDVLCGRSFSKQGVYLEWKAIWLKGKTIPIYQDEFVRLISSVSQHQTSKELRD